MLRLVSRRWCHLLEQSQQLRRTLSVAQSPSATSIIGSPLWPRISIGSVGRLLSTTEEAAKEEMPPILGVGKYKTSTGLVCIVARTSEIAINP